MAIPESALIPTRRSFISETLNPLLRSKPAKKIHFKLGEVELNGEVAFPRVAMAVFHKEWFDMPGIAVRFRKKRGVWAWYTPSEDTLYFPDPYFGDNSHFEEMVIIHECVHAWLDIAFFVVTKWATGEAVAYVAEALYHIYTETRAGHTPTPPNPDASPAVHKAFEIAMDIMDTPGATVPHWEAKKLKDLILAGPAAIERGYTAETSAGIDGLKP